MNLLSAMVFGIVSATIATAQTPATATPGTAKGGTARVRVVDPDGPPPATFLVPATNITLLFPQIFRREDPVEISHRSYRSAYGKLQDILAGGCAPILLELGAGDPISHAQNPEAKHFVPEPPTGGIVLQEILPACLHDNSAETDKLANLAAIPRSFDGFKPLSSMVVYNLAGFETDFSAVSAYSKDRDGQRRLEAGMTFVGSVSMGYKGKIFLWTVTANDPATFNSLLKMRLRFDNDRPWPLVPFELSVDDGRDKRDKLPQ